MKKRLEARCWLFFLFGCQFGTKGICLDAGGCLGSSKWRKTTMTMTMTMRGLNDPIFGIVCDVRFRWLP